MNPPSLRDPTSHESCAPWYSTTSYYFRGNQPGTRATPPHEPRSGQTVGKRQRTERTGAVQDAGALSRGPRPRASVLECASPLSPLALCVAGSGVSCANYSANSHPGPLLDRGGEGEACARWTVHGGNARKRFGEFSLRPLLHFAEERGKATFFGCRPVIGRAAVGACQWRRDRSLALLPAERRWHSWPWRELRSALTPCPPATLRRHPS